jgi:hypothetical protein
MLKLSIYCTRFERNYSTYTCRSSIYVVATEALMKKERQGETQKSIKIEFHPFEC